MTLPFVPMTLTAEQRQRIEAVFKTWMDAAPTPNEPAAIPLRTEEPTDERH